ncbi:hypothetical protein DBR43_24030 [Pedobacter sp. KBW06]|uniref:hypothetical protein n=1 Tax=Pedobacter sp. KBW06 TaxID=2153359 RepID=UPI000F599B93|nr:hypothetical protein [Pedobacter sp. KBW06]RQO67595.1 hypothetical protein DBR43_24030 [Pedobacter sp. KBW06]
MKTNKKAWLSAMATIVLVAVIGLVFAFKPFTKAKERAETRWYYTHPTSAASIPAAILNGDNWAKEDPGNQTGCLALGNIPCTLLVDASVMTSEDLEAYFLTEYSDNAVTILNNAESKKFAP